MSLHSFNPFSMVLCLQYVLTEVVGFLKAGDTSGQPQQYNAGTTYTLPSAKLLLKTLKSNLKPHQRFNLNIVHLKTEKSHFAIVTTLLLSTKKKPHNHTYVITSMHIQCVVSGCELWSQKCFNGVIITTAPEVCRLDIVYVLKVWNETKNLKCSK